MTVDIPDSSGQRQAFGYTHVLLQHLGLHVPLRDLAPPNCRFCQSPSRLVTVQSTNENGNAGRPYYRCHSCQWDESWVTWADGRGLDLNNVSCDCGRPSRRSHVGANKTRNRGSGFWTCATGTCDYYMEDGGVR